MEPIDIIHGTAAPLMRDNIDTDVIIRIDRLAEIEKDDLGPYAFEAVRYRADGTEDPDFVLIRDAYREAPILIAGHNFGCGSSREGAVWALAGSGIRCIIAPSFGGIFTNNCYQNGLLPIVLDRETVDAFAEIARQQPGAPFKVDLREKTVTPPNGTPIPFEIDSLRQRALLAGLDDLGLTLQSTAAIEAFQARDRAERPWVWPTAQHW